jgi:Tol biopolymer transport system component
MNDPRSGNRDVWVVALDTGSFTRLTSHPASDWFPVWSPDGGHVLFASDRDATSSFYRTRADGSGGDARVFTSTSRAEAFPTDWSAAGNRVAFHSYPRGDVWLLPLQDGQTPVAVVQSSSTDWLASLSPDGQWIAYVSDESGADEVYVRAINGTAKHRVSLAGGVQPRWRRDGRELFFLAPNNWLVSVPLSPREPFDFGRPTPLFEGCASTAARRPFAAPFLYRYDISADGQRSLWLCSVSTDPESAIVAIDW